MLFTDHFSERKHSVIIKETHNHLSITASRGPCIYTAFSWSRYNILHQATEINHKQDPNLACSQHCGFHPLDIMPIWGKANFTQSSWGKGSVLNSAT